MLTRTRDSGLIVARVWVLGLVACGTAQTNITPDEARTIAKEAYIYGFPVRPREVA